MRKLTTTAIAALLAPLSLWAGPEAMTFEEARHLVARTGFGAAPDEVAPFVGKSYAAAVDDILGGVLTKPTNPMPAWANAWAYPQDQIWALGQTKTDLYYTKRYHEIRALQRWWLREMIETPSPLTEKLVLFWHDHFATGADNHERPQWAAQQNQLFRTHAAGNFADLAAGVLQDPGMLAYLTNTENNVAAPNENLAREFMELFTLGEGRGYDEADVVEVARALTGHTVNTHAGAHYTFDPDAHDHGIKTILGDTGRHNADDLPRLVMNDPAFGPFVVERLWRAFVSDQPDPAEVDRLVTLWRDANWEMQPLLRGMFLSDAFWDPPTGATIIKSPVDLMVGSVRSFGVPLPVMDDLVWAVEDLGQDLFFPPNVGGWPEGKDWINDASASSRATVLSYMLDYDRAPRSGDDAAMMMMQANIAAVAERPTLGPDDLSIGQIFVTGAERFGDEGGELTLTLFDLQFQNRHWRSLTFSAEVWGQNNYSFALQTSDCEAFCFTTFPERRNDAFGWVWFDAEDVRDGNTDWMTPDDRVLLASVMGHLPAVLDASADQILWTPQSQSEGSLSLEQAQVGAGWLAEFAATHFGSPAGGIYVAPVAPASVGLGGFDATGMSDEEVEKYLDMQSLADNPGATPRFVYPDAATWLAAIPTGGFDSLRAEATLLSLPLPAEGQRMERDASDPEALIRHIVLSPYYQLN